MVGIFQQTMGSEIPTIVLEWVAFCGWKERVGGAAVMSLVGGLGSRQRIAELVVVVVVAHGPAKIAHCAQAS